MAHVPVPGTELTPGSDAPSDLVSASIPASVDAALRTLWADGHAAYVVGGSLRDTLMGRHADDWDLATSAPPHRTLALFSGQAVYENEFGTVAVRPDDGSHDIEITTMRSDHDYADFRRPHHVEFTDSIELDLSRRDFTVNAMAWGAPAGGPPAGGQPALVDPYGGRADLAARVLRAVGEPRTRFEEDALRMVRAVRFAATLGFTIEPVTLAGIQAHADLVGHLSGERIATELGRALLADRPSLALRLMSDTGLLASISPELAAQRGVPQNKIEGEDLWDHTVRSVDAAPRDNLVVRMAALLHDIGKPSTFAEGQFLRHESVGAAQAGLFLDRIRWPRAERDRIAHLVRQHMFGYQPSWSAAAVRRFIAKVGVDTVEDLFLLREADNVGSGRPALAGGLDELRARVAAELDAGVVLDLHGLDIDGNDLMSELGLARGPEIGRLLRSLLDRVIADPDVNQRATLLKLARSMTRPAAAGQAEEAP